MTDDNKAIALAIQVLAQQFTGLPLQIAANTGRSIEDVLDRQNVESRSKYESAGFGAGGASAPAPARFDEPAPAKPGERAQSDIRPVERIAPEETADPDRRGGTPGAAGAPDGKSEDALLTAIRLLTQHIADLPLALASVHGKSAEDILEQRHAETKTDLDPLAFGRDEGFGDARAQSEQGRAAQRGEAAQKFETASGQTNSARVGTGDKPADIAGKPADIAGKPADLAGKPAPPKPAEGAAPGGKPGGGGLPSMFGGLGGATTLLTAKFAAVLGPLAMMSQVLQAPISGFQVLGTSAKVLAGTLAPVLLPVTVLLATALTALSDVVLATLMPGLEGFFSVIVGMGIPAVIIFIDAVRDAAEWIEKWTKWFKEKFGGGEDGSTLDQIEGVANLLTGGGDGFGMGTIGRAAGTEIVGTDTFRDDFMPTERADTGAIVMNALRDVMGSMRASMGPKAQISGLESVGKSAQLAALNQDPLEARMLRTQQQIFQLMERAVARMENDRHTRVYGGGGGWADADGAGGGGAAADRGDF